MLRNKQKNENKTATSEVMFLAPGSEQSSTSGGYCFLYSFCLFGLKKINLTRAVFQSTFVWNL